MLVRKTISFSDVDLKVEGDKGRFSGYASVFGGVDSYGDTILQGAFASTLRQKGLPKMFFNHEWNMPVGKWLSAKEDDHGLFVEGEITPGLSLAADVYAAMKHGTLDGLSIGGMLKKGDYDETETGRVIRKWSHLVEVSPVVFPADGSARIDASSVKGETLSAMLEDEINSLETIRDFESFLRDAGGFSKGAAKALAARARSMFNAGCDEQTPEAKALAELADRLKRLESVGG
jgi:uncharacterized protein